jgi:hypothetical protein
VPEPIFEDFQDQAFEESQLVGAMPTVQGFVRCDARILWLVIIPKSKDRFMERPTMKTVQP